MKEWMNLGEVSRRTWITGRRAAAETETTSSEESCRPSNRYRVHLKEL